MDRIWFLKQGNNFLSVVEISTDWKMYIIFGLKGIKFMMGLLREINRDINNKLKKNSIILNK